jgi:hypothetical protein
MRSSAYDNDDCDINRPSSNTGNARDATSKDGNSAAKGASGAEQ